MHSTGENDPSASRTPPLTRHSVAAEELFALLHLFDSNGNIASQRPGHHNSFLSPVPALHLDSEEASTIKTGSEKSTPRVTMIRPRPRARTLSLPAVLVPPVGDADRGRELKHRSAYSPSACESEQQQPSPLHQEHIKDMARVLSQYSLDPHRRSWKRALHDPYTSGVDEDTGSHGDGLGPAGQACSSDRVNAEIGDAPVMGEGTEMGAEGEEEWRPRALAVSGESQELLNWQASLLSNPAQAEGVEEMEEWRRRLGSRRVGGEVGGARPGTPSRLAKKKK